MNAIGMKLVDRVLALRQEHLQQKRAGPFDVLYSSDLAGPMCSWYRSYCGASREAGNITVKDRIGMIAGIDDVEIDPDLPPDTIKVIVFELPKCLRA